MKIEILRLRLISNTQVQNRQNGQSSNATFIYEYKKRPHF